ncbi:MAG TPA: hypothetical protein VGJ94_10090 [Syntrophorhabdaceae bacterium]
MWEQVDEAGKRFTAKKGNKIITLSAEENAKWASKLGPLFEDYVKNMKAKGLPGDDVLKFAREYIKANGEPSKGTK